MERFDVEVEIARFAVGDRRCAACPEPADEFRERGAELRLAWAAAADWPSPINLLRPDAPAHVEDDACARGGGRRRGAASGLGVGWWHRTRSPVANGRDGPRPFGLATMTPSPRDCGGRRDRRWRAALASSCSPPCASPQAERRRRCRRARNKPPVVSAAVAWLAGSSAPISSRRSTRRRSSRRRSRRQHVVSPARRRRRGADSPRQPSHDSGDGACRVADCTPAAAARQVTPPRGRRPRSGRDRSHANAREAPPPAKSAAVRRGPQQHSVFRRSTSSRSSTAVSSGRAMRFATRTSSRFRPSVVSAARCPRDGCGGSRPVVPGRYE